TASITASIFFSFTETATTVIYTLSLHDALPILSSPSGRSRSRLPPPQRPAETRCRRSSTDSASPFSNRGSRTRSRRSFAGAEARSEEHTSELQSPYDLVCRLLLEKKNKQTNKTI